MGWRVERMVEEPHFTPAGQEIRQIRIWVVTDKGNYFSIVVPEEVTRSPDELGRIISARAAEIEAVERLSG
jgi:hypothetical protein